jgi:hypothetical protein
MKFVKKILFLLILLVGLSVASMAQKPDDPKKNPPPKNPPPVINPGKGNPNPPKGDNKPKKPNGGVAIVLRRKENGIELG